jgi:hypothetical protein
METEEDGHNSIALQKPSDNQGNVNGSQKKEKEKQDLLKFSQGFVGEEGKAKLQEIMERFRDKESEVEFFRQTLKQRKSFTPQERKSAKLFLCEIIPGVETNLDLEPVLKRADRVIYSVDNYLSPSLISRDAELQATINFVREIRAKLREQ